MTGFNSGKSGSGTAKYQLYDVLRRFDPRLGVTNDVVKGLNDLGLANFYGGGQTLGFRGVTAKGLAAGLDPHDFEGDFIRNFTGADPNDHSGAMWQYDWYEPPTTTGNSGLSALTSFFTQPAQTTTTAGGGGGESSWLSTLISSLTNSPSTPSNTTTYTAPPSYAPAPDAPPVNYYSEPGPQMLDLSNPQIGQALRVLAMRQPELYQRGEVTDPLMAQLLQLIGV